MEWNIGLLGGRADRTKWRGLPPSPACPTHLPWAHTPFWYPGDPLLPSAQHPREKVVYCKDMGDRLSNICFVHIWVLGIQSSRQCHKVRDSTYKGLLAQVVRWLRRGVKVCGQWVGLNALRVLNTSRPLKVVQPLWIWGSNWGRPGGGREGKTKAIIC